MEAQFHLPLEDSASDENKAAGSAALVALLTAHPDGLTGQQIARLTGREWNEKTRRVIRRYREAAGLLIVSGQQGYQLAAHCSVEDRSHAANQRLTKRQKMIKEALRELSALDALEAITNPQKP